MKMKSQRRIERDRARRDARDRVREAERPQPAADDDAPASEDDLDLEVARRLRGYDA